MYVLLIFLLTSVARPNLVVCGYAASSEPVCNVAVRKGKDDVFTAFVLSFLSLSLCLVSARVKGYTPARQTQFEWIFCAYNLIRNNLPSGRIW